MIPSHIENQVKRILGAGSLVARLPADLERLLAIYIATIRCVSSAEPDAKDIASLLVSLAAQSKDSVFERGQELLAKSRGEIVKFFSSGVSGYCLVESPAAGLIWIAEDDLDSCGPVSSTVEKTANKGRKPMQPAAA